MELSAFDHIPFNRPSFNGNELKYITQTLTDHHISGNGEFTRIAENLLFELTGSKNLLTTSCSHALELSARLLDFSPGDEVIVPSFTFVTTASSFALHGATPVFVDVEDDTLNIDPEDIFRMISPRTRAICVVHYAGISAPMNEILEIATDNSLVVVEDNAHGLGGRYFERNLGTMGTFGTHSFHETKNFTSGEGGSIAINDSSFFERAEILREKGTNRSNFLRGAVDKYSWCDLGSSWVMSEILAAVLVGQLEQYTIISDWRSKLYSQYEVGLSDWATKFSIRTPHVPSYATHTSHLYYLRFPDLEKRTAYIEHMSKARINVVFHYQALHQSKFGQQFQRSAKSLTISESASDCLVRLPLFNSMTLDEVERVIQASLEFNY